MRSNIIQIIIFCFIASCQSIEPRIIKVEDRIKPPYNYLLLQAIDNDTRFDYKWSDYDDGYLRMGSKFIDKYDEIFAKSNAKEEEFLLKAYKKQKNIITERYKQNGEKLQVHKEQKIVDAFIKALLDENESIIDTEGEFLVVNDINIVMPKVSKNSEQKKEEIQEKKDEKSSI